MLNDAPFLVGHSGENGQIWFYGNDICEALGYKNSTQTIQDHIAIAEDKKTLKSAEILDSIETIESNNWKNSIWVSPADRKPKTFISEYGMYALVMGSKKEEVERCTILGRSFRLNSDNYIYNNSLYIYIFGGIYDTKNYII